MGHTTVQVIDTSVHLTHGPAHWCLGFSRRSGNKCEASGEGGVNYDHRRNGWQTGFDKGGGKKIKLTGCGVGSVDEFRDGVFWYWGEVREGADERLAGGDHPGWIVWGGAGWGQLLVNGIYFRAEEVQKSSALIGGCVWWEGFRSLNQNLWRIFVLFKESAHSSLLNFVLARCSTSPHGGNLACRLPRWSLKKKNTLPLGLRISASPVKWWNLWTTLSVWMLRQTLYWKERSWYCGPSLMAEAAKHGAKCTLGAICCSASWSRTLGHAAQLSLEVGFERVTFQSLDDQLYPLSYSCPKGLKTSLHSQNILKCSVKFPDRAAHVALSHQFNINSLLNLWWVGMFDIGFSADIWYSDIGQLLISNTNI